MQIKGGCINSTMITQPFEYQVVIDEKSGVIEIKNKVLK